MLAIRAVTAFLVSLSTATAGAAIRKMPCYGNCSGSFAYPDAINAAMDA